MIAAFIVAITLFGFTPLPVSELHVGSAAYYSPGFDEGGWEQIVRLRQSWGQLPADFVLRDGDFYCTHPDYDFGTRLVIVNAETGKAIHCAVVDTVAPWDVDHWKANAVIELSYVGFVAVDAKQTNRVVVMRDGG